MSKIVSLITVIILFFESVPILGAPTLTVDASDIVGKTSTRATGFLYGLAESGVPSEAMTNSLSISSVSQKVVDGLQHPSGDIDGVYKQLDNCDYITIYLQDAFDTWYYCYDEIMEMRSNGTYDWKEFLYERYFPIIKDAVEYMKQQTYADRLVYCIFNECDNAVWFGNYIDGEVHFDDIGKANFYEAWKLTYDYVKSIDEDAVIGGPGYFDYDTSKITGFLTFCKENNCVPEIIIYHELSYWSIPHWEIHVEDYRNIEKNLGIEALPIIVTEYGVMEENGNPADMLQYICAIERTDTWANMAFWRLSNNLNDTSADDNSPNSNWWLFRKYAEMSGQHKLKVSADALIEKSLYDGDDNRLSFDGVASLSLSKDEISVICNGSKNKRNIKITGLDETNLGEKVTVKVECVYYEGLTGIVSSPTLIKQYQTNVKNGKINIGIKGTDSDAVYFVSVSPYNESDITIRNTNIPVRYEFENGKLLGDTYTYDSAYATTGETAGMVGGIEKEGDGVSLKFRTKTSGLYDLTIIFGKHNNAPTPDDRDFATAKLVIDGKEQAVLFENTIKSEFTTSKTLTLDLSRGKHTVEFYFTDTTFVLDSMIVKQNEDVDAVTVLENSENNSAFLAVAPEDGYYTLDTAGVASTINIDGAEADFESGGIVYLRRGLNEITFSNENMICNIFRSDECRFTATIKAADIALEGKAQLLTDKYGTEYIDNISKSGGQGTFTVSVPEDGTYRVTLLYANNSEGGVHAYNVDLIERYLTVSVNGGEGKDFFCRNTYSRYTYKTMTFNLDLYAGENKITLTNSGNTVFYNLEAFAPQIAEITVNSLT